MSTESPLSQARKNLRDLSKKELAELVEALGQPRYRAGQLYRWLFAHSIDHIEQMTDLPRGFRRALMDSGFHLGLPQIVAHRQSADGTTKLALRLEDGSTVESVLIPDKGRLTLCVSTQTGCNMGCTFCHTARLKGCRNLTQAELFAQVELTRRLLARAPLEGYHRITNMVLMGMGEPLDNLESVLGFIKVVTDPQTLGMSQRRITLSTVGLLPALKRLLKATGVNIALSLNAPDDSTRTRLMPVNRLYPLKGLMRLLRYSPLMRRRSLTIEYVLIEGVNSSVQDARRLVALLKGMRCKVNLIAFNPFEGCGFRPPDESTINGFRSVLERAGLMVLVRKSRGRDILAACGQLGGRYEDKSLDPQGV